MSPTIRRPNMRTAALALPNGFTLANLFCGIWAIVQASHGNTATAGKFIVLGGIADALDGRVARATRSGTRFGSELDSLVDAISFGLAPALIMYFAVLQREGGDWIAGSTVFIYSACATMRLARFNVEQAGRAKTHFHGLPSPAAGMTLATYYWFSQSTLYNQTMIADWPWHTVLPFLMVVLAFLMVSDVSYPAFPTVGYRTASGLAGSAIVLGGFLGLFFFRWEFFFPALVAYVAYGVVKDAALGLLDRVPTGDTVEDDEDTSEPGGLGIATDLPAGRRRRRKRRRHRLDQPTPAATTPVQDRNE